jgi:hypothetical protein
MIVKKTNKKILMEKINKINQSYLRNVRPIFQKKCLDCHGNAIKLPWYSSIPGIKQLIQHDIKEAKKHMDMSNDFPFAGHGTLEDNFKALRNTVNKGNMPPLRYKLMHWGSSLSKEEKKIIDQWVTDGLFILHHKLEKEIKR